MKEIKISIIIPVYNVEKYIRKCIESIMFQSYSNLEIIVVNDGTKDNSIKIVEEYLFDKRIKILTKKNGGVSSARNEGLKIATGDYIHFVDPDDWLENYIYDQLLKEMSTNEDVVCFNYKVYDDKKNKIINSKYISEDIEKRLMISSNGSFYFELTKNPCWNKIYRRDFLNKNKLFFIEKVCIEEDRVWNLMTFFLANRVKYIDTSLYNYRINVENSAVYKRDNFNNLKNEEKIKIKKSFEIIEKKLETFININKKNWNQFKILRTYIYYGEIKGKNKGSITFKDVSDVLKKYLKEEWNCSEENNKLIIYEVQNFLKNRNFKINMGKNLFYKEFWRKNIFNFKILKKRVLRNLGVKNEKN